MSAVDNNDDDDENISLAVSFLLNFERLHLRANKRGVSRGKGIFHSLIEADREQKGQPTVCWNSLTTFRQAAPSGQVDANRQSQQGGPHPGLHGQQERRAHDQLHGSPGREVPA